jgi:hypothetical protein
MNDQPQKNQLGDKMIKSKGNNNMGVAKNMGVINQERGKCSKKLC